MVNAVEHCRALFGAIRSLKSMNEEEIYVFAKEHQAPVELVKIVRKLGRLPVVTFAAGGIATPADVVLTMKLGCDGVFVGSGIFKVIDLSSLQIPKREPEPWSMLAPITKMPKK